MNGRKPKKRKSNKKIPCFIVLHKLIKVKRERETDRKNGCFVDYFQLSSFCFFPTMLRLHFEPHTWQHLQSWFRHQKASKREIIIGKGSRACLYAHHSRSGTKRTHICLYTANHATSTQLNKLIENPTTNK